MTGTLPDDIGSIDSLKYLYLDNNKLSGEIPQSIGNLKALRIFHIYKNELSGLIPGNICNLYVNELENDLGEEFIFRALLHQNNFCPPYPECIHENHLGPQSCSY